MSQNMRQARAKVRTVVVPVLSGCSGAPCCYNSGMLCPQLILHCEATLLRVCLLPFLNRWLAIGVTWTMQCQMSVHNFNQKSTRVSQTNA